MTTLPIQQPDDDDDGFTEKEMESLIRALKEVILIKKGELKPLTMDDLWTD